MIHLTSEHARAILKSRPGTDKEHPRAREAYDELRRELARSDSARPRRERRERRMSGNPYSATP